MKGYNFKIFVIILFCLNIAVAFAAGKNALTLQSGNIRVVISDDEPEPLKLAAESFYKDFRKIMLACPEVLNKLPAGNDHDRPTLVIVNRETDVFRISKDKRHPVDGFESHRVWVDPATNYIYLEGADMRGTIFAIYTFSEKILGVPPLWYWCSWEPDIKKEIVIPGDLDLYFKSPQVRFRAWVPNDTDLFGPWCKQSDDNNNLWLETMLRLKLNTVESYNTVDVPYRMVGHAMQVSQYGMVLTSHHVITLNASIGLWDKYWKIMHGMETPPELSLANEDKLIQFWRYCAETVAKSGIENLWNISFRGNGDKPFWATFPDAPEDEKERGKIINKMLNIQMDIIREYFGEQNPYVRITFYDEMADLLAKGYVTPPAGENMIWTYVAGRRDHYPYDDIQQFDSSRKVKLGYYLNFQFSSTGAHLAPAEGPWKMEFNYRYVNSKSPLYFSVVNAGNLREFLFSLSANARMMWDFNSYSSDVFAYDYAAQYFGEEQAGEIARLYKDFFYAYWEPKKNDFPGGMERQYIFQDQRYARAIAYFTNTFFKYTPDPLPDLYGFERVAGRVFRVVPADNNSDNQVDAILNGMRHSVNKFENVVLRSKKIINLVPESKQLFFQDNMVSYSEYMEHLSRSFYSYVYAYKNQTDKEILMRELNAAIREMEMARNALFATQHGVFGSWYAEEHFFNFRTIMNSYNKVKQEVFPIK
jgi:hypothetical protein